MTEFKRMFTEACLQAVWMDERKHSLVEFTCLGGRTRYRKLTQLRIKRKGSQSFVSIERKKRYKSAIHKFCFWPSHVTGTNRILGAISLLTYKKKESVFLAKKSWERA